MKIAIFTDVFLEVPGGIGSVLTAAKKSLEAAGHEVAIFCPGWSTPHNPATAALQANPAVHVVPTLHLFKPNGAPWARRPSIILKWLQKNHPELADFDLFHIHYEGPVSLAAVHLARAYHKPIIQTLHGREDQALASNIPRPLQPLVATILNHFHAKSLKAKKSPLTLGPKLAPGKPRARMWQIITRQGNAADLVIAPSHHFAEKLTRMGLKTRIQVLENGIDDDIVPLSPQIRTWDGKSPLQILWNSRLSREKRFLPFLQALKIAGDQGFKYELTAFGDGNDYKSAQKYIAKNHLSVHLVGPASRPQILRKSTHSHLSVITSYDFDVHSLILVEAEACGTPLLICDPDMEKSLVEGSYVLTRDPSPAAIAESLLSLTPRKIQSMSARMLTHRRAVYQSSRIAELIRLYQSVIK